MRVWCLEMDLGSARHLLLVALFYPFLSGGSVGLGQSTVGVGYRLMMERGSCERVSGKEVTSTQEGHGGSGVGGMGQKISGRRDLGRGQSCVVKMGTRTYNMMRNEDFSMNRLDQL